VSDPKFGPLTDKDRAWARKGDVPCLHGSRQHSLACGDGQNCVAAYVQLLEAEGAGSVAEARTLRKALRKVRGVLGEVGVLTVTEAQRIIVGIVNVALAPTDGKRKRGLNRVGCRLTGDVCAEHDLPKFCRHGCWKATAHDCQDSEQA